MGNNAKQRLESPKKSFLEHDDDTTLQMYFNGTRIPINLEKVTVDYVERDGAEYVKALHFYINGEEDHHLNIGELNRQYEDDPIVQELLSYVVRAELLYVLEKSWLAQREREQQDDQPPKKKRKK